MIEAMVALAILIVAVLPLSVWMLSDARLFRDTYGRAVAVELVDGEMEALAAGDWRNFPEGTNIWKPTGKAAQNLPDGQFFVIRSDGKARVEWRAGKRSGIGSVVREAAIQ